MNRTNRFLNRMIILIVGVLLLALGSGTVLLYLWPAAAEWWRVHAVIAHEWLDEAITRTSLGNTTASWVTFGALAAIVLIVVVLIVPIARLGSGRTHTLLGSGGQEGLDGLDGRITIETGFASDALQETLSQRPEILSSRISTATVRGKPLLHVSITPRQGTSPRRVADEIDRMSSNLMTLTGSDVPTYISIHAGLRSRLAREQRQLL